MKLVKTVIVFLFVFLSVICFADKRPIIVAVVDSGIDPQNNNHMCKYGHKSFASVKPNSVDNYVDIVENPLYDGHGHGTHIAGLIEQYAGNENYCLVSVKFWTPKKSETSTESLIKALQYAINIKVDIVNISAGGTEPNSEEKRLIQKALDMGIVVVSAAGNERSDLNKKCNYYPACYDPRIIVVGNLNLDGTVNRNSNVGSVVTEWAMGTEVFSNLPGGKRGQMTGTSQATAIVTGRIVHFKSKN